MIYKMLSAEDAIDLGYIERDSFYDYGNVIVKIDYKNEVTLLGDDRWVIDCPEDAYFHRGFDWIVDELNEAYDIGYQDGVNDG